MNIAETIKIAASVIISLGGSGAIILGLSNFLGKVWAERLMVKERAKHNQELTELQARLERTNQEKLKELQTNLEIYRETYLKEHSDKLAIYRLATDVITDFLADISMIRMGQKPAGDAVDRFNRGRLKAHGYLAMLAPQQVMDAYDSLIDNLFSILEKPVITNPQEDWKEMRRRAYVLINTIREDVGIDKSKVEYHGKR